jgi:hypothetical protein
VTELPSVTWRQVSPLPEVGEPEQIAERLLLLAHYGADFDVWGGSRRMRYWDALAERAKAATFAGPTLADWWSALSMSLSTSPRNPAERADLAGLLAHPDGRQVLRALRDHADVLVLRVRVIAETRKAAREHSSTEPA